MEYDLVFEGGGAKGMTFVGALQALEKRGVTHARLMGASAGAIMATFLAAGYTTGEMAAALNETKDGQPVFLGFLEIPPNPTKEEIQHSAIRQLLRDVNVKLIPDFVESQIDDALAAGLAQSSSIGARLFSFIEKGGLYAAQNFVDWLRDKLNTGIYPSERGEHGQGKARQFGDMTMAEYRAATGVDLSLIASDTTSAQILILNHRTAPDCPLVYAVRMSMSFPLLWQEVVWQSDWGKYRGKDLTGHTVVDGGMLSNFPIELFLSNEKYVTDIMGQKEAPELNVIGFLIDETLPVPDAPEVQKEAKGINLGELQTVGRVMKLINTMTQAHDKIVIDAHEDFVVRLPAKGYGTIEFGMSDQRRVALVNGGLNATEAYMNRIRPRTRGGKPAPRAVDEPAVVNSANRIAAKILAQ
jgi:predicted acylesterase/phospholipase RssA